jgi:hypothetical protein
MKKVKRVRRKKGDKNYLTNSELYPALMRAKKINRITPELGKMFYILVDRYSEHPWWVGYSIHWHEEMKQEALLALCKGALKFNPDYALSRDKEPNPFAYCTTIVYRAFKASRDRDKKFTNLEDKMPPGLY